MAWYIDSWAVRDGLAFASERDAETIEASATVHIAPPDFRPVPIARISTAMAAARGHFQERLYDFEGEIAFSSLEKLIEMVRRGYLGGGGPGLLPPEGPGPEGEGDRPSDEGMGPSSEDGDEPDGDGGEYWQEARDAISELSDSQSRQRLSSALAGVLRAEPFKRLLDKCAADMLLLLARSITFLPAGTDRVRRWELCELWAVLIHQTGIPYTGTGKASLRGACAMLDREVPGAEPWFHRLVFSRPWPWLQLNDRVPGLILDGSVLRIRVPRAWLRSQEVSTLGSLLCRVASDRLYLRDLADDHRQFVPLLLLALVVSAGGEAALWDPHLLLGITRRDSVSRVQQKAADWLAALLAGRELEDHHRAEKVLSDLSFGGQKRPPWKL